MYPTSTIISTSTAPLSWTDLNLASFLPQEPAFVYLKLVNNSASTRSLSFRTKGDTEIPNTTDASLWQTGSRVAGGGAYVYIKTDNTGIIQWISNGADPWTITLIGYSATSSTTTSSGGTITQAEFDTLLTNSMDTTNSFITLLGGAFIFLATMAIIMFYFKGKK